MRRYDYFRQALKGVKKPCAYLELDALKNNLRQIEALAQGKKIRIASKSIRSVEALKLILDSSPVFQGVMCFTVDEALFLADKGIDDLLIAYPVWREEELTAISRKVIEGTHITLMVDSEAHVKQLETTAERINGQFHVCMDIDLSMRTLGIYFGVYRSAIKDEDEARALARRIRQSAFLDLDGVMGYEAQIAGVTDKNPHQRIKSAIVRLLKKQSKMKIMIKRAAIVQAVEEEMGRKLRFVNGGGTGSLESTGKEKAVTEMTAGSGFYSPHLFDKYAGFQFEPATGFAIEITRIPQSGIYTCTGGGYTASGAAGRDKLPEIYLPEGAAMLDQEGAGEVQTPIRYKGSIPLSHGDPIFMRHSKAGELCERFHELQVIENGEVVTVFSTYRGEGMCFL